MRSIPLPARPPPRHNEKRSTVVVDVTELKARPKVEVEANLQLLLSICLPPCPGPARSRCAHGVGAIALKR